MSQATNVDHYQRILRVLMHIQRHLDEELSLDALAEVACFSPYHFHRVFAALVGESLMAHVRRLRLERAAFRLRVTKDPVIRIALEAGYETHEAFTRAFRASFGESPSGFRRKGHYLSTGSSNRIHFGHEAEGLEFEPLTYGGLQMEIRIENWNPKCVAFVRHVGPYAECGRAWEALCGWAGPKGLLGGAPWVAGVSYDDPAITPPEQLRYDACLAVPDHVRGEGPVGVQTIEGGAYAVVTHKGPYEDFHQTYSYLYAKGLTFRDAPCVEVYLNDPDTTPPADLLTDICIPVRKLG